MGKWIERHPGIAAVLTGLLVFVGGMFIGDGSSSIIIAIGAGAGFALYAKEVGLPITREEQEAASEPLSADKAKLSETTQD